MVLRSRATRDSVYSYNEDNEFSSNRTHTKTKTDKCKRMFDLFSAGKQECLSFLDLLYICEAWSPNLDISKILSSNEMEKDKMSKNRKKELIQFYLCGRQAIEKKDRKIIKCRKEVKQ